MRAKAGVAPTTGVRRTLRRCSLGAVCQRVRAGAWALGVLVGSLGSMALGLSCAGPLSDACDERGSCRAPSGADAALGDAGDAGAERACDPTMDPADDACVLDNALGVFVASAADAEGDAAAGEGGAESASGDGSMARPYTTIAQGLANLGSKARIYVCNGPYGEQVNVTTAVSVYGGLSCASGPAGRVWSYVGGSAQVISPSPLYALSVVGAATGSVTIEDVSFATPSATAAGGSSLAALITSSAVNLVRVTLSAGSGGNGAPGADGIQNPNYTGTAPDGGSQVTPGPPGSGTFQIAGGVGGLNRCTHSGVSAGGGGGYGCAGDGLGSPGTAMPKAPVTATGRDGLPGADGGAGSSPAGDPGADGLAGDAGLAAEVFGSLSATGWTPGPGKDGDPGNPGQGGAGATDPLYGSCGSSTQSIGGGGGGAGGCGGAGGKGGGGGGASIALASVTSTIELTACTLSAAAAGNGGAGGAGQDGQAGAPGGDAMFPAEHAAGGAGGNGAGGSGGAGGAGGISVGILNLGSMITSDKATTTGTRVGAAGAGGAAGLAGRHSLGGLMTGMDGHSGAPGNAGTSVAVLQLM